MKKILALALAFILAAAACGIAGAEREARRMETAADAEEWAAIFLGGHPEELEGAWALSSRMEAALAGMGGIAGLAKQMAALGTPEKVGPAYEGKVQGYRAFYIPCVFSAMPADLILVVEDGAIAGLSTGSYSGKQEEAEPGVDRGTDLALPVPGLGELPGILTIPKGGGPFPAVILLQGSGPSNKDEETGALKPFRDIAEGLAEHGIATYRFDKRSYVYGDELAARKDITLEDEYLEDAVNAVRLLAGQEKIDPDRIWVLGHSLGGNAIPAVAGKLEEAPEQAAGFIMMAASPRPLDELIREQYDFLYSLMPEVSTEQQAEKDALFAELDRLKTPDALTEDDRIAGVYAPYWKWLAAYDILEAAEKITKPVLLLQGEEDYQVTMADFAIWQEAFGTKPNWRMIAYPGLTHPFVPGRKTEGAAAYRRAAHVDRQVIDDMAAFILSGEGGK